MASADASTAQGNDKTNILQKLRANPLIPLIVGVAVAVAVLAGLLLWASSPNYSVLYSGLQDADGGAIIARLDQMNVPYEVTANGSVIKIPQNQVDKVRLTLASDGLPKSGGVGFEIMDDEPFGISQFAEHVNYMRALQGELARSIETLNAVSTARVHLAIPKPTVFVRKTQEPRASVVVSLYHGRSLGKGQVNAIVHLVSSSVANLAVDHITVVDTRGQLLSGSQDDNSGADASRLEYITKVEQTYRKRIKNILAPVVGRDNIHAQVEADIDFSTGEQTEKLFGPNQSPHDAAVRSKQINVNLDKRPDRVGGIPGALTNQPPTTQPSPINNPQQQQQQQQGNPGAQADADAPDDDNQLNMADVAGLAMPPGPIGDSGSSSRSSTINYEVNQTIRHTRKETGQVKRLSAAVIIDYKMMKDDDGDMAPTPLSDERMDKIRSLVKQAIGYSVARGDALSVINVPFSEKPGSSEGELTGPPWWRSPYLISLAMTFLKYLLIVIVAFLLWRKLIRPLLDRVPLPGQTAQLATAGGPEVQEEPDDDEDIEDDDEADDARRERRRQRNAKLRDTTREMARDDPRLVAMIVKSWIHKDAEDKK